MNSKPKVKICCISSISEAKTVMKYKVDALGLVGNMPSGPGVIDDELIEQIVKTIPSPIESFLLTSETKASEIIAHHRRVNSTTIQLVDAVNNEEYKIIRDALPTVKLVQVIHVTDENSIEEAIEKATFVDMILLDSGNPTAKIKVLGGTGRTHNWKISREICKVIDKPVFLAGGLNEDNITEAIETVRPYGVDLCSGVRTNDVLDEHKLANFFAKL